MVLCPQNLHFLLDGIFGRPYLKTPHFTHDLDRMPVAGGNAHRFVNNAESAGPKTDSDRSSEEEL